jgi:hypothetical protein
VIYFLRWIKLKDFNHRDTENTEFDPEKTPIYFYTKEAKAAKIDPG